MDEKLFLPEESTQRKHKNVLLQNLVSSCAWTLVSIAPACNNCLRNNCVLVLCRVCLDLSFQVLYGCFPMKIIIYLASDS